MFWRDWPRPFQVFLYGATLVGLFGLALAGICILLLLSYS